MLVDEKSSKRYLKMFKIMNKLVVPLYRLRILAPLGFRLLLMTHKGRKTGKTRRTPVEYFKVEKTITVVSGYGKKANWFRNIKQNPEEVYVQVGFRGFHPRVEIIEEQKELEKFFKWLVINNPRYSKAGFGWDPKNDDPETHDFSYIASLMRVIKFHKTK
jgi:deazaflavin-dependent oxidoreductase (nitroreductase family)